MAQARRHVRRLGRRVSVAEWTKVVQPSAHRRLSQTIAAAIASGLTDRDAGTIAGIRHDTMTEWRKDPEFSEAIEKATAERLLLRLERIEAGAQGWQGTAWALEDLFAVDVSADIILAVARVHISGRGNI
jgi:hypothetical protein